MVVVAIELDREPIEELNPLVVVATELDKLPILVDTDELNEPIVELIELDNENSPWIPKFKKTPPKLEVLEVPVPK